MKIEAICQSERNKLLECLSCLARDYVSQLALVWDADIPEWLRADIARRQCNRGKTPGKGRVEAGRASAKPVGIPWFASLVRPIQPRSCPGFCPCYPTIGQILSVVKGRKGRPHLGRADCAVSSVLHGCGGYRRRRHTATFGAEAGIGACHWEFKGQEQVRPSASQNLPRAPVSVVLSAPSIRLIADDP